MLLRHPHTCDPGHLLQGGKTIRGIVAASGASDIVTLSNNGSVQIIASTEAAIKAAKELIELQLDELPVGTILRQRRVESVTLFGVFVELAPGKSGLVHLSELAEENLVEVPPEWKVRSWAYQIINPCRMSLI